MRFTAVALFVAVLLSPAGTPPGGTTFLGETIGRVLTAADTTSGDTADVSLESGTLPASWYAGDSSCTGRRPFQVHAYNPDFYILRQAACTNYEKPFLYLLFGRDRALLLDTGAGHADLRTPVDTLVRAWLARHGRTTIDLVVAHSHAHGDHVAGDSLFAGRPNTVLVGRDSAAVRAFFGVARWPADAGTIDLGGRILDVLPIPGHQPAGIALYDRRTGVLLTGDTFYPGRLYVRDTAAFAASVHRLTDFARTHPIIHLLGAHVEQTRTPFRDYPVGTVDQPDEHVLELTPAQLLELDAAVQAMRGRIVRTPLRDVTVWPVP
jgi:glyoxylase-like metal-dependent hydrolase (beta-lactamase superfamily II)